MSEISRRGSLVGASLCVALGARLVAQQPAPPPASAGPSGRCELVVTPRGDSTRVNSVRQPSGQYNSFVGGGVTGTCPAQSLTLTSDSAEYFGDLRRWHLIGAVHYREPRLTLDSRDATYFMAEERLLALGDVHTLLPSGTTLVGPRVEYFRQIPVVRPIARMIAPGRPTITIIEHDSSGKPAPPMVLIANTVVMDEDSLVYASGKVDMTRSDVIAKSDSAFLDGAHEFARLMRTPSIKSKGARPFTLFGTVLDLTGTNKHLRTVLARGAGKAVSESGTVTADTLLFAMGAEGLERMFAWGPSRARAVNPQYDILADSIDAWSPNQRLRVIRAIRLAFAQSTSDSVRMKSRERDWMRGDTIVARFDTTPPLKADSGKQPAMRELIALGNASSYYKIPPKDSTASGPAINYVKGGSVTVAFVNHQVQQVTVRDSVSGVYIEPAPAPKKKPDSTASAARAPETKVTP